MSTILQANYRRSANPTVSVPAPRDGNGDPFWADHLALNMNRYAVDGFRNIQLPPVHITIGRDFPDSDGYGVLWEYSLGSDANPTRFGTLEKWRRCCAIAYANNMPPLADWVPHQRYGGNNGTYLYDSSGGKSKGRFPKHPSCFRGGGPFSNGIDPSGRVPDDNVPDYAWDISFGDELCPINAIPKDYVLNGLIDAGDWLFRTLNLVGCRDDDTKGQAIEAVNRWSNAKAMKGKFVIGEYAGGDRFTFKWWVDATGGRCYTFDFNLKYLIQNMCNNGSKFDMTQLVSNPFSALGPYYAMHSCTFLENADSDTNGFGTVIYNKLLGYAYMLTATGWPCVYFRDYATDKYCYGLAPYISNLNWIQNKLASGDMWYRHAEYQFVVYERIGWPGLLVGLNNDVWDPKWKHARVQTNFGSNVHLKDYSGHGQDIWTDQYGMVDLWIPPNNNGTGYVCYSRIGQEGEYPIHHMATTQMFEGADDLPDETAKLTGAPVGRIWCAKDTEINLNKLSGDGVRFAVLDANEAIVVPLGNWSGKTSSEGWHSVSAYSPTSTPLPYVLDITYTAPQTITKDQL